MAGKAGCMTNIMGSVMKRAGLDVSSRENDPDPEKGTEEDRQATAAGSRNRSGCLNLHFLNLPSASPDGQLWLRQCWQVSWLTVQTRLVCLPGRTQ